MLWMIKKTPAAAKTRMKNPPHNNPMMGPRLLDIRDLL
jgi:hypothetical protein